MSRCNELASVLEALGHYDIEKVDLKADLGGLMTRELNRQLHRGIDNNRPKLLSLPAYTKQRVADLLFSRTRGVGGSYPKEDIGWKVFTIKVTPSDFLSLAKRRDSGKLNDNLAKEFAGSIFNSIKKGEKPRLGVPFLHVKEVNKKLVITGHEGRHRADMLRYMMGHDVTIPVDIKLPEDYTRIPDLSKEQIDRLLSLPLRNENGMLIKTSLKELSHE